MTRPYLSRQSLLPIPLGEIVPQAAKESRFGGLLGKALFAGGSAGVLGGPLLTVEAGKLLSGCARRLLHPRSGSVNARLRLQCRCELEGSYTATVSSSCTRGSHGANDTFALAVGRHGEA